MRYNLFIAYINRKGFTMDEFVVKVASCVTLTPDCKKMLKVNAKKRGMSQSALVELAVREIVERWAHETAVKS
jgi:hypothetical protein